MFLVFSDNSPRNTVESFFLSLKRGVVGSWHHVIREHLPKYADEFALRWTHRKETDGQRTVPAIQTAPRISRWCECPAIDLPREPRGRKRIRKYPK
jgi:hypothetical protein